jgi:pyridoxamine 5'-phosphate oxidase
VIDPAAMRRSYERGLLDESTVPSSWLDLFTAWFADAVAELTYTEANAMQVATVEADGRPAVRTVLAKGFGADGVVFYTNYDSAKGRALSVNPYAAAVFAWVPLERQVRISGPVTRVERETTEAYFASRPRGAQIGAWASPQSSVLESRAALEDRQRGVEQRYGDGPIPAPEHWGGYRIAPEIVEFWQGRQNRLHDRLRFCRKDEAYVIERLAP